MRRRGARARALMEQHGWLTSERLARAIVDLAGDDEGELEVLLRAARTDPRDVLAWDADRRAGVVRPPMSEARVRELTAWAGGAPPPRPPGTVDLVLTDAGDRDAELLRLVRELTGLGLADVSALLDDLPARLLAGTTAEHAEALRARVRAAGGAAELR